MTNRVDIKIYSYFQYEIMTLLHDFIIANSNRNIYDVT